MKRILAISFFACAVISVAGASDLSGHWEQREICQEFRGGYFNYCADTGKMTVNSAGGFTNHISSLPDLEDYWTDAGTVSYIGNGIVRVNGYDVAEPSDSFQFDLPINSAMDCMLSVQWELDERGELEDVSAAGLVKSPSSSTVADLAGQWRQYGMFVERTNQGPWEAEWEKTSDSQWLTIDSSGDFTMPLTDSYGSSYSESGQLVQTSIGVYGLSNETNMNLALNASKDLVVRGLYAPPDDGDDPADEFSFILYLKKGSSYQISDLNGRWNLSSLYYDTSLRGELGVMTITNGIVSGIFTDWDGAQETLSGTVSIDSEGFVTFTVNRTDNEDSFPWWTGMKFFLNAGKSVLAGCWTDDGELMLDFAVKAPAASPEVKSDLTITGTAPASQTVYPGQPVQVTVTTKNNGTVGAYSEFEPQFDTGLVLSTSDNFSTMPDDPDDIAEQNFFGGLAAGASLSSNLTFNAPSTPGTYYLRAKADEWDAIDESDENNNWGPLITLTVVNMVAVTQPSSGSITQDPAVVQYGGSATFTATVPSGYKVDYWLVNGSQKSAGSVTHTENNITGSLDVSVVFKKQAAMPWLNLLLE
jgi:hypothetical protein